MKVKPIEHKGENLIKFWCAGCGQFHTVAANLWNEDKDKPTLVQAVEFSRGDGPRCVLTMHDGVITWDASTTHRLKGKSLPMQHEEAWRDGGHRWNEVQTAPPLGTAAATLEAHETKQA